MEESFAAGASVARVARERGINANQVFTWRRKYRQGRLPAVRIPMPELLAVQVTERAEEASASRRAASPVPPSGTIQIELAKGMVRIRGNADPGTLRTVLEVLTR